MVRLTSACICSFACLFRISAIFDSRSAELEAPAICSANSCGIVDIKSLSLLLSFTKVSDGVFMSLEAAESSENVWAYAVMLFDNLVNFSLDSPTFTDIASESFCIFFDHLLAAEPAAMRPPTTVPAGPGSTLLIPVKVIVTSERASMFAFPVFPKPVPKLFIVSETIGIAIDRPSIFELSWLPSFSLKRESLTLPNLSFAFPQGVLFCLADFLPSSAISSRACP